MDLCNATSPRIAEIFRTETLSRGLLLQKFVRMEEETSLTRFTNAVLQHGLQMAYRILHRLSSLSISSSSGIIHLITLSHCSSNKFHQLDLTQEIHFQEELRSSTTKSDHQKERVRPIPVTPKRILILRIRLLALNHLSIHPGELSFPNRGPNSRQVV